MIRRWSDLLNRFGSCTTGLFDNREVERFLRDVFARQGRSNDFRKLDRPLYVIGVDLDSGEAVRFGDAGWGWHPDFTRGASQCRPARPVPASGNAG